MSTKSSLLHQDEQKTSDDTLSSLVHGKQNTVTAQDIIIKDDLQQQQQQQNQHINDMQVNVTNGVIINSTLPPRSSSSFPRNKNRLSKQKHHHRHYHIHHYCYIHHHHHHYNYTTSSPGSLIANKTNTTFATARDSSASISTINLNYNTQGSHYNQSTVIPANKLMPIFLPSKLIDPIKTLPPILIKESAIISNNHSNNNDNNNYATEEVDSLLDTIIMDNDDFEITRTKVTDITRKMQKYHVNELDLNYQLKEKYCDKSKAPPLINISSDIANKNDSGRPLSPLSVLCPTTNSLIQTRFLLEQEPNTSIASQIGGIDEDQEGVEKEEEDEEWINSFLSLMSTVITYSENLENISIELLRTEGKVRELILLQKSLIEQFDEREKIFNSRLIEYEETSKQQINLIDQLIELDRDLDLTEADRKRDRNRRSTLTNRTASTTHTNFDWQSSEYNQLQQQQPLSGSSNNSIYSNSKTTIDSQYLISQQQQQQHQLSISAQIDTMKDIVHKLRWEVGLKIGGGIGTGHIIHSFQSPFSNALELIVAGSGTLSSSTSSLSLQEQQEEARNYHDNSIQSSSIKCLNFHRYNYMIHINSQDRKSKFKLIPKSLWTPDDQVDQCQFKTCNTIFSFYQRRHHCRRCGHVICQRHSLNRLPLFKSLPETSTDTMSPMSSNAASNWYRICDTCFYDLIIINNNNRNGN